MDRIAELTASIKERLERIDMADNVIRAATRESIEQSRQCGDELLELKEKLGHGKFGPHIQEHFPKSATTAQDCMTIAKEWDLIAHAWEKDPELSKAQALKIVRQARSGKVDSPVDIILKLFKQLEAGTTDRDVIEQSSMFGFRDGRAFSFNDEISCSAEIPESIGKDFVGAIPAKPFRKMLEKAKKSKSEVEMYVDGKDFVVATIADCSRAGLKMMEEVVLPIEKVPSPGEWKPLPDNFSEAVSFVVKCVGKDVSQYTATCVNITPNYMEACDWHQGMRYKVEMDIAERFLIRGTSLLPVTRTNPKEFGVTESWVHFRNAEGFVYSCRRDIDYYEPIDELLDMKGDPFVIKDSFVRCVEAAEVFSAENADSNEVTVELSDEIATIEGHGLTGWYSASIPSGYEGEPVKFTSSPKLLIELAKWKRECILAPDRLKIETPEFEYIVALGDPDELAKDRAEYRAALDKTASRNEKKQAARDKAIASQGNSDEEE